MVSKRVVPGLFIICLALCGVLLLRPKYDWCAEVAWCDHGGVLPELGAALLLLPLLLSVSLGVWAGFAQLHRTHRFFRYLRPLLGRDLPAGLCDVARKLQIHQSIDVLKDTNAATFCYGWLRPRIVVTTGLLRMLTPDELEAVLRHEQHHMRRHDPLRMVLATIVTGACWWTPGGDEEAAMQRELEADRVVIDAGGRAALARALVKLLAQPQQRPSTNNHVAVNRLSVTDARVDQLLQTTDGISPTSVRTPWYGILVACTILLLLCGLMLAR